MNINLSNSSGKPLYEQITRQIKSLIMSGALREGEALPSMRVLAKELRISLITTKRAYEDLEREGFLETVPGKGSFVAKRNYDLIMEEKRKTVEENLSLAVQAARESGIPLQELMELLNYFYMEE